MSFSSKQLKNLSMNDMGFREAYQRCGILFQSLLPQPFENFTREMDRPWKLSKNLSMKRFNHYEKLRLNRMQSVGLFNMYTHLLFIYIYIYVYVCKNMKYYLR